MANGSIALCSMASADNMANICTKPLGKVKFSLLCSMMGIVCLESLGCPEQGGVLKFLPNVPAHDAQRKHIVPEA